jgi:Na+-transporting NADH:ubiquinone oxidoreductase subunit NqrA
MGGDLAVNEFEAAGGFGDLITKAGGELGEEIAMFECGGFGVLAELADIAGEQGLLLTVEGGEVAVSVKELTVDAEELGGCTFACNGCVDFAMVVKEALEGFNVTALVGLIGAGHEAGEVP